MNSQVRKNGDEHRPQKRELETCIYCREAYGWIATHDADGNIRYKACKHNTPARLYSWEELTNRSIKVANQTS